MLKTHFLLVYSKYYLTFAADNLMFHSNIFIMEKPLSVFRIKTEWIQELDNGALEKTKTEELVYAVNYTDAETIAYAIAESEKRTSMGNVNIEIIKTKIDNILVNDILKKDDVLVEDRICTFFEEPESTGVGLYAVKVEIITIDEKSGKEKHTSETIYVPASSNTDATLKIREYMEEYLNEFVIRDAKFDKAWAIYWPQDLYSQKVG